MKIRLLIEMDLQNYLSTKDEEERRWFENEVLVGNRTLILHSNEIGDYIGEITSVKNIEFLNEEMQK